MSSSFALWHGLLSPYNCSNLVVRHVATNLFISSLGGGCIGLGLCSLPHLFYVVVLLSAFGSRSHNGENNGRYRPKTRND